MPHLDIEHPTRTWTCNRCGDTVERYRGQSEVTCDTCHTEYNSSGQQLRDDWRDSPAWRYADVDDMTGFEQQQLRREIWGY